MGYERTEADTVVGALERIDGRHLAKLPESPFYPEGGGQVADGGTLETASGAGRVIDVFRVGDDQAVALEPVTGELREGDPARALVDRAERLATMANHTATHLLHAALRAGSAAMCARPAPTWGPTSSASTSPMASASAPRRRATWRRP